MEKVLYPQAQTFLNQWKEENNQSWSYSSKVQDQTGIELKTPGSAIRLSYNCATGPGKQVLLVWDKQMQEEFTIFYYK